MYKNGLVRLDDAGGEENFVAPRPMPGACPEGGHLTGDFNINLNLRNEDRVILRFLF